MRKVHRIGFLLLLMQIYATRATPAEDVSPVLVWGIKIKHRPALGIMSKEEFRDIIQPLLNDHMLLAFAEKDLSVSDFNCMNNKTHIPCFRHMRQIKPYAYFPRVEKPLATFHTFTSASFSHYPSSHDLQYNDISCQMGTAHTIFLPDLENASRVSELEMHDAFISNVTKKTLCNVVFLFMAGNRPTEAVIPFMQRGNLRNNKGGNLLRSDRFNIYFTDLTIIDGNGVQQLNVSDVVVFDTLNNKLQIILHTTTHKNLTFDVDTSGGYYSIKRFIFESHTFTARDLFVPDKFSYYCASLELRTKDAKLRWENLQFELYAKPQTKMRFSAAWHCTGFVSVGIISGLFVMTLILTIVFVGICWIMDVNTCDRYEDPKGKPLVIVVRD